MAFDISYIFTAKDKYSATAKKVAAANEAVKKSAEAAKRTLLSQSEALNSKFSAGMIKSKAAMADIVDYISKNFVPAMEKLKDTGEDFTIEFTIPIMAASAAMIHFASDGDETRSKFSQVFSSLGKEAEDMADKFAAGYGVATAGARDMLAGTGDLLTGMGLSQKQAAELSLKINTLAVDLASFTNYSGGAGGASEALTKSLLGEREQLKSLGIAISDVAVKKKIMQMMSAGSKFKTLEEATAYATLALITDRAKNSIGDFNRTKDGGANMTRRATESLKDLAESYGKFLLPIQQAVNRQVMKFSQYMMNLSPATKTIILGVAALVAVMGPLMILIGSIGLVASSVAAGWAALGVGFAAVAGVLTWPIILIAALAAGLVYLLVTSKKVHAFFKGFVQGLKESMGPALTSLVADLSNAAAVITSMFGSDSESGQALDGTAASLNNIASAGQMLGKILGGVIDGIITGLSIVGDLAEQIIAAIVTMDFSQFDMSGIKKRAGDFAVRVGLTNPEDGNLKKPLEIASTAAPSVVASGAKETASRVAPVMLAASPAMVVAGGSSGAKETASRVAPWSVVSAPVPVAAKLPPAQAPVKASEQVVKSGQQATLNGQIKVSASPGSKVDSVDSKSSFRGINGNVGIGVAG